MFSAIDKDVLGNGQLWDDGPWTTSSTASERVTPLVSADHARHALEIMVKAQESSREDVVKELSCYVCDLTASSARSWVNTDGSPSPRAQTRDDRRRDAHLKHRI